MADDFQTTHWSVVLAAGEPGGGEALAELCESYWHPLYAFARRKGNDPEVARDLTQGFFAMLLEKNWVADADPDRGRFRAFLLTAFRRYVGHERERGRAKKRGGGRRQLSLDFEDGERRYTLMPSHDLTPERIFERRWAITLLDLALEGLAREWEEAGRSELFAALRPRLAGGEAAPYAEVAERFGMTEAAVKVSVHRLRARYRELLRIEVGRTLADPSEVDDEIRRLKSALE
jgi:RNA polymerase sigma-70 factor (ECF subfamily)